MGGLSLEEEAELEGKETLGEVLEVRNSPGNSDWDRMAFPPEPRPASDQLCMCLQNNRPKTLLQLTGTPSRAGGLRGEGD